MPYGYLIAVVLVAWCTCCALWPLRRPRSLGRLSWRFGFLVNELPFVAAFWLLASTLLAYAQRDIATVVGRLSLLLAVLTTLGLGMVAWRGLRAGPAIDDALSSGLGAGWRDAINLAADEPRRPRLPLVRILLWPFPVGQRSVERVANISYGDAGVRNLLDVYRHRSHPSGCPVLIYLHGGGFGSGHKHREARPLLSHLANRGWVCASANYRLSPAARFPDHLVDVKKVIAWVREHGHEFGADPTSVLVAGSSAGGHLASMAALTANVAEFQPGFEDVDTSVTAAISLYGYYGPIGSGQLSTSPVAWVGPHAPPFLVAHGDHDTLVPVEGARGFVESLRSSSHNAVVYAELPGGQHSFDLFHSLRFDTVVNAVEQFATWVRA